jgi:FdhD protein
MHADAFGISIDLPVVRAKSGRLLELDQPIATEVPFTIVANGVEVATLLASPCDLKCLAVGFLFTSGFIRSADEVRACVIDPSRWVAHADIARTPDASITQRRLYTSGCGKGVMYASVSELATRQTLESRMTVTAEQVREIARWLASGSEPYRATGGLHTAALSRAGGRPWLSLDDIGRHNAVDKVIGRAVLDGEDFSGTVLVTSGRVSSEILHKALRAGIAIIIARGAPTHQAVLRADSGGVTIVGFARGEGYTVYSHVARIRAADAPAHDAAGDGGE